MPTACRRSLRTRLFAALAAAAVLLAGLLLALPTVASAAEKGLATDLTWGISSGDQTKTGTAIADLGARWVRIGGAWADIETSKGHYSSSQLGSVDNAVTVARNAGAKVDMFVDQSPSWASGSSNKNTPPLNVADYANFVSFLANRYRGQVDAYEIWNEENTTRFWSTGVSAGAYAALLKAAYVAIKAADPNAKVVFGGTAFNDHYFLESAYAAAPDLGRYFDVMATHPYPWGGESPEDAWRNPDGKLAEATFSGYRQVHDTLLAHGDNKPIWFTEFGWSTTSQWRGVSQAVQADYLQRALRCVEQDSYVQVALWYNLRNNYWARDADTWEDQLGLMSTGWSHKPAYDAFKSYVPGAGGCTYVERPGPPDPPPGTASGSGSTGTSGGAAHPSTSTTTTKRRTTTSVRVRAAARSAAARAARALTRMYLVSGRVNGSTGGRVLIYFERKSNRDRKYHRVLTRGTTMKASGAFSRGVRVPSAGSWRVQAVFPGTSTRARSASRLVYFRV